MDDPIAEAESELHEMQRAARRVAGHLGPVSDELARRLAWLEDQIRLVGWRVRMEVRVAREARAAVAA